jgi:hypothetical protein
MTTVEELLGRKGSSFGLENRQYGCRDLSCSPRDTLYSQQLALPSLTSGGRSVGEVPSQTKATGLLVIIKWVYSQ